MNPLVSIKPVENKEYLAVLESLLAIMRSGVNMFNVNVIAKQMRTVYIIEAQKGMSIRSIIIMVSGE